MVVMPLQPGRSVGIRLRGVQVTRDVYIAILLGGLQWALLIFNHGDDKTVDFDWNAIHLETLNRASPRRLDC